MRASALATHKKFVRRIATMFYMIGKIKKRELLDKYKQLTDFLDGNSTHSKDEIYDWIAKSVGFFTHVGVNEIIIKSFIDTFQIEQDSTGSSLLSNILSIAPEKIGPFKRIESTSNYKLPTDMINKIKLESLYYVFIAFRVAKSIIDLRIREERLVPIFLIQTLSGIEKYTHILSSLNEMERTYESQDSEGLCKHSITLLGSVLSEESTLKDNDLGWQLKKLLSDKNLAHKFGIDNNFITGLNNSRIIRNYLSGHKKLPLEYDIPFMVSVSFAYLTLLFLEITISVGDILDFK